MKKILSIALMSVILIAGCSDKQEVSSGVSQPAIQQQTQQQPVQQQVQQQPVQQQPVVIQNDSGSTMTGMAMGMMLGSMLSNSGNSSDRVYEAELRAREAEYRAREAERRAASDNYYHQTKPQVQVSQNRPSTVQPVAIGTKVPTQSTATTTSTAKSVNIINAPKVITPSGTSGTITSGTFKLGQKTQPKPSQTLKVTDSSKPASSEFKKRSSSGFTSNKSSVRSNSSFTSSSKKK